MTRPIQVAYGQTWTRIRPVEEDWAGDPKAGATVTPDLTIDLCVPWPRSAGSDDRSETRDRRESTVVDLTLFVPFVADVVMGDRMRSPSARMYQVLEVEQWPEQHPFTGWAPGYKPLLLRGVSNA